jgi:porin
MPHCPLLFALIIIGLGIPLSATAQSDSQPSSGWAGLWSQKYLTGDWDGLRTQLENSGVTLGLSEQSEGWGNVMGGIRRGATYDGLTTAAISIDLQQLLGWAGASFFVNAFQIHGLGPSGSLVGNLQFVSNIEATDGTKLYDLWLEQKLLGGRLDIRVGQEGANDEMMLIDAASLFLNSSFGYPALTATDLPDGGPNYPLATPFIRIKYNITDALTLVEAVYNGDPAPSGQGDPQVRDGGGTAFRLNDHALEFTELWWSRNRGTHPTGLPATYKLGVWFDSGRFADVEKSAPSDQSPGLREPVEHRHDYGIYGIAQQSVWRNPARESESIALFLQVMVAPDDRNLSNRFIEAGLNWKSPFPGRDNDAFGLAASYEGISPGARRSTDPASFGAVAPPSAGNETVVEATYLCQAANWLALQPDAQYVLHPGAGILTTTGARPLKDAFVMGVRATIQF